MPKSVIEKVRDFILENKEKNTYVFWSKQIDTSIKNYLIKEKMLYSPIRWIYVLKKSDVYPSEATLDHKFTIISLLWWILSGDFAINYYLWNLDNNNFKIITENKNFETTLWEWKNISLTFTASKVARNTQIIDIKNNSLIIETALSLIINDFWILKKYPQFKHILFQLDISNIWELIKNNFKISGISKLALFYKNEGFNEKYILIKNKLNTAGKRLDNRDMKSHKKIIVKQQNTTKNIDLNSLL